MVKSDLLAETKKASKPKATKKVAAKAATKPKAASKKSSKKAETKSKKCATGMQKTKKGCKPKRDPLKPKRAGSPYLLFCNENRDAIKKANPTYTAPQVLKACGEAWQKAKLGDISKWEKLAAAAKEVYVKKMAAYKATAKDLPLEASEAEKSED